VRSVDDRIAESVAADHPRGLRSISVRRRRAHGTGAHAQDVKPTDPVVVDLVVGLLLHGADPVGVGQAKPVTDTVPIGDGIVSNASRPHRCGRSPRTKRRAGRRPPSSSPCTRPTSGLEPAACGQPACRGPFVSYGLVGAVVCVIPRMRGPGRIPVSASARRRGLGRWRTPRRRDVARRRR
jgi:hypothetical protein